MNNKQVQKILLAALFCLFLGMCVPTYAASEEGSTQWGSTEIAPVTEPAPAEGRQIKPARASASDTVWQKEFQFDKDSSKHTITLRVYTGTSTELVVPSKAVIGGTDYTVILGNDGDPEYPSSAFYGSSVRKLSFEPGVRAANETALFCGAGVEELDLSGLDTSGMTTMREMFFDTPNLKKLNLSGVNSSGVTDMGYMFSAIGMTSIDVTMLDLSHVTNMEGWFDSCSQLTDINAHGVKTPSLTYGPDMFRGCRNLRHVDISSFDFTGISMEEKWKAFAMCGLESITLNSTVLIPSSYQEDGKSALLCWNTKKDGSGKDYFQGQYCQEDGAVTLYRSKRIPTGYTAVGMDGYKLYKNDKPGEMEYVYCLNHHMGRPENHQFAITDAKNFGGFSKRQKLMLAAAILMKDHAGGASIQNVIWRITDGEDGSSSKTRDLDAEYYQYIEEHCEELEGIYEMNFYISSDNSIQNLLSAQQVRVPTSLKIMKKLEDGDEEDKKREYVMQLTLTDSTGKPLTGSYTVHTDEADSQITPDADGNCSLSIKSGQYAVIRNLPVGTKYKVAEDAGASEGFEVTYADAEGSIEADKAKTVTVTNTKKRKEVEISKQDISGNEIEGATLQITQGGKIIEEWKSEKDLTHKVKLKPGDYVLCESGAPDGYIPASEIPFTVTKDLKVTVNGAEKDKIVMTDEYEAGKLTVQKTVTGSMGDRAKKFGFTILLMRDGEPVSGNFPAENGSTLNFGDDGKAHLELAHGESVTITGIRTGTSYIVTEDQADQDGYSTVSEGETGTISTDGCTASFTNTREGTVPTGADTGGIPAKEAGTLGVLLCAALAGWMTLRKYMAL